MGLTAGIAALVGALGSSQMPDGGLLVVFATMALLAAGLFLLPGPSPTVDQSDAAALAFNVPAAIGQAGLVGFAVGLVGQAGSSLFIPLMVYVLRVSTRVAIGSNLGIILFAAAAGLGGKLGTAQVPLLLAVALVGGTVPATQLGALASRRTQPRLLRFILVGVVTAAAIGIWLDVFL